jgi:hypothetical protein
MKINFKVIYCSIWAADAFSVSQKDVTRLQGRPVTGRGSRQSVQLSGKWAD